MIRKYFFITFLFIFTTQVWAQKESIYPQYRSPLDIPLFLSGTFSELRGGHFHAGLDIKTKEKTGKKVHAVSNGYVSRIKVQGYGYGKALYITHPDGYTSVYAHLERYNKKINAYISKIQYRKKSYEVDITVPKGDLKVKKGQVVAYSGNSGSSGGPHLHFEIRKSAGQLPMNPMKFGCKVKDNIYPSIKGFKVYDVVNGDKKYALRLDQHHYQLKDKDTLLVANEVSFGIQTIDRLNGAKNSNGVYAIRLFRDDKEVFSWAADMFSFAETRYINAFIDYQEYKENKRRFVMTKKLPGNHLSTYKNVKDDGVYKSNIGDVHYWRYEISDYKKNKTLLSFITKTINEVDLQSQADLKGEYQIFYNQTKEIEKDGLSIHFPQGTLYEDLAIDITTNEVDSLPISCRIGDDFIPVHKRFKIIANQIPYPEKLHDKLVWALFNEKSEQYNGISTILKDNQLIGKSRAFGLYAILPDTIAPKVKFLNEKKLKSGKTKKIKIRLEDDLSGIQHYELMVNNRWVLAEYDPKNRLLVYRIDKHAKKGKNKATCIVTDNKGNITKKEIVFKKL